MRLIAFLLLSGCLCSLTYAQQTPISAENSSNQAEKSSEVEKLSARQWLERMSSSIRNLNFSTSFVVVKDNRAEPYRWFHGVVENKELEILALLNGPRFEVARKEQLVSYFEPNKAPYSVVANAISGPIPIAFSHDIDPLERSYNFVSVGRSRILGRPARLIRIVPKDKYRHGYWLWIDEHSGLLLKAALVNRQGELLEQVQFTHLDITEKPADTLLQLNKSNLPAVVESAEQVAHQRFSWKATWLPTGFKLKKSNRHEIAVTGQLTEFMQFNDGLVDVSIYVNPSKDNHRPVEINQEGATSILTQVNEGVEISIVGKIPASTAKEIADSIHFQSRSVN